MPNADGYYTGAEKRSRPEPRCPICNAWATQQWVDAGSSVDYDLWMLGRVHCPKAKDHPRAD